MNTQVIYSVQTNTDQSEGRGSQVDTGIYFTEKADAVKFTNSNHYKRYAVMGYINLKSTNDYNVKEKVVNIFESITDYEENNEEIKKIRQLEDIRKKLTDEEIKLLGI